MGFEIEKKYLLHEDGQNHVTAAMQEKFSSPDHLRDIVLREGSKIRQGYLPIEQGMEIASIIGLNIDFKPTEARLRDKSGSFYLTLKSEGRLTRHESPDAEVSPVIFELYWPYAKRRVEKVRLEENVAGSNTEIDVYMARNLIIAEVEVATKEIATRLVPLGLDVTDDSRYKNAALAEFPSEKK